MKNKIAGHIMRRDVKKILAGFLISLLAIAATAMPLHTAHSPKIEIFRGGYGFHASYKIHSSSSSTDLIVNSISGRDTAISKEFDTKIFPGRFGTDISFQLNNTLEKGQAVYPCHGHQKITQMTLNPTSLWHQTVKKLLKKANRSYFKIDDIRKLPRLALRYDSKAKSAFHIEALPGCELNSLYLLRIASEIPRNSPLPRSILVRTSTQLKTVRHKKMAVTTATFCTKRKDSVVTYIKTENGLQEISRKNIKKSSIWYSKVKEAAELSMQRYEKFSRVHHKMF